jgi:hypothetical protein
MARFYSKVPHHVWDRYTRAVRLADKDSAKARAKVVRQGLELLEPLTDELLASALREANAKAQPQSKGITINVGETDEDRFDNMFSRCSDIRTRQLLATCIIIVSTGS